MIKKMNRLALSINMRRYIRVLPLLGLTAFIFIGSQCSKSEEKATSEKKPVLLAQRIVGLGRVEPELRITSLSAEIPGIISEILANPGKKLNKGDIIIRLSDRIEQARLEQAKSQIQVQQSQIESAKAALEAARAKLLSTKNNYLRLKKLVESQAKPESAFEQAQAEYDSLVAEIFRLKSNVVTSRYVLKQLQAELDLARAQLAQKTILAPENGLLLSVDIPVGSYISPGETVGSFAPESPLSVWCEIDELFADRIKPGQKVFIRIPGRPEIRAEGIVSFAGPWLRKKSIFSDDIGDLEDRRIREVRIQLNPDSDILPGSRVECDILAEK
jgi:HlyD family secretion protein